MRAQAPLVDMTGMATLKKGLGWRLCRQPNPLNRKMRRHVERSEA